LKETTFVIKDLDNGWVWQDVEDERDAEIYCCEELDIPQEWIDTLECYTESIKVSLRRSRTYFRDDWYVNLQRVG
jgi:hypothetical protein